MGISGMPSPVGVCSPLAAIRRVFRAPGSRPSVPGVATSVSVLRSHSKPAGRDAAMGDPLPGSMVVPAFSSAMAKSTGGRQVSA